jgi:hypothetical protein
MTISNDCWHFRLYLWWYREKNGIDFLRYSMGFTPKVNLCPYVRAVLFWSWLRWLFLARHWRSALSWPVAILGAPFAVKLVFPECPALLWDVVMLAVVAALAGGLGVVLGVVKLSKLCNRHEKLGHMERLIPFRGLLAAYWRAVHDRICPFIEVR